MGNGECGVRKTNGNWEFGSWTNISIPNSGLPFEILPLKNLPQTSGRWVLPVLSVKNRIGLLLDCDAGNESHRHAGR